MTSHSGFWTRSSSVWGSRREATSTLLASAISPSVRWRMKTGLPRHLMMTCGNLPLASLSRLNCFVSVDVFAYVLALGDGVEVDLGLGHGQNISGSGHVDKELCRRKTTLVTRIHLTCDQLKFWNIVRASIDAQLSPSHPIHPLFDRGHSRI